MTLDLDALDTIAQGIHNDPFAILGMHEIDDHLEVRCFQPHAERVGVIAADTGSEIAQLTRLHAAGFFAGTVPGRARFAYRLALSNAGGAWTIEDPYRFPLVLSDYDIYLLAEGTHHRSYERLGAHGRQIEGVDGTAFAVWAPNAHRVAVIGDFNDWDHRCHPMRLRQSAGIWELFLPGVGVGALYKFAIRGPHGEVLPEKADPFAFSAEPPPRTASVVWPLPAAQPGTGDPQTIDKPISIYEVHLGSWKRGDGNRYLSYAELADDLLPYVRNLGFTHVELMPISEHPFDGSWGYQPTSLYAPTRRFGTPDQFRGFVDRAHALGLKVIIDWVPGHFPTDPHGLGRFDGTALYEHVDPREGRHMDWDTLIYNYGRNEVANFLLSNATFWIERYGIDGLRVDAVASMIYRNYSRREGEWLPNQYGGVENLEATRFLKRMNELVFGQFPAATTFAEESTAWPMVSRPTSMGGLGFGFKWNMGWMHDSLDYIEKEPIHRLYHHDQLTFGLIYAFTENFVLPVSHDEVVHGKRSLIGKMPGDQWQRFATLRAYLGFMFGHPGKKLLFMGNELAQEREWNHDTGLDWGALGDSFHLGVQALVRDLNYLYRGVPALHVLDCEPAGFEWIEANARDESLLTFLRRGHVADDLAIVACNFTPVVREQTRIGVPEPGFYRERLNTDSTFYNGSNVGNGGGLQAEPVPWNGRPYSIAVTLPPLATVFFTLESAAGGGALGLG
jgi:1,4-alpha-glucan branching enzyme